MLIVELGRFVLNELPDGRRFLDKIEHATDIPLEYGMKFLGHEKSVRYKLVACVVCYQLIFIYPN